MIDPTVFSERRARLVERVDAPILLMGNGVRTRNLPMSALPFRQDSTFLFFTGCTAPGAALLLHEGRETLYLVPPSADDPLWHGPVESIQEHASKLGFATVRPADELAEEVPPGALGLAVPDDSATRLAARLTDRPLSFGTNNGPDALVDAIIALRRRQDEAGLHRMRAAAAVSDRAHRAAMAATRPGRHEAQLAAVFDGVLASAGMVPAYPSIVTVRGEVLHNFHYVNTLEAGQLLLLDGGAEDPSGYASDVTRTWPVSGTFTPRQRAAYDAVLEAELAGIEKCRAGVRYRDVHTAASRVLARWLADEGLLRCSVDEAVETGAHAVFFPHGVGHLIGLDVHDLEAFGDRAAYAPGRTRSEQFGTAWLRLDLDLEPGFVVTVEPGFYVVPAILQDRTLVERFSALVDFARAREWIGFGGIRIEDDVVITAGDPEVLTAAIPKRPDEVAALVGTLDSLPF